MQMAAVFLPRLFCLRPVAVCFCEKCALVQIEGCSAPPSELLRCCHDDATGKVGQRAPATPLLAWQQGWSIKPEQHDDDSHTNMDTICSTTCR